MAQESDEDRRKREIADEIARITPAAINDIIKDSLGGGNMSLANDIFGQLPTILAKPSENPHQRKRDLKVIIFTTALTPQLGMMAGVVARALVNRLDPPGDDHKSDGMGARLPKSPNGGRSGSSGAVAQIGSSDQRIRPPQRTRGTM